MVSVLQTNDRIRKIVASIGELEDHLLEMESNGVEARTQPEE